MLANRLSRPIRGTKVLVIEAGGKDTNPWIHIPAGFYRNIYHPKITWQFETEPVPGLDGRRISWPRGKVLGGSSSINGLIYIRGQRQDFDYWRQLGCIGWGYDDVLPYFRRAENQERGADDYHGAGGPLDISDLRARHELHDAFIAAAQEAGFKANPDFNGAEQEGVGSYQLTVRKMRRCSAALAYLRPAIKRPNLTVEIRAFAQRGSCSRASARSVSNSCRTARCAASGRGPRCCCPAVRCCRRNCCNYPGSAPATCCASTASRSSTNCPRSATICRTISAAASSTRRATATR